MQNNNIYIYIYIICYINANELKSSCGNDTRREALRVPTDAVAGAAVEFDGYPGTWPC
jgi:hypothetical protein